MSDWSFCLRQPCGSFSSEEGSDADTTTPVAQLEEETVEYRETPWSIAKINAIIRQPLPPAGNESVQRTPFKPKPPLPQPRSDPVKDAKKISFGFPPPKSRHVGPLFDGFKKQAELGKQKVDIRALQQCNTEPPSKARSDVVSVNAVSDTPRPIHTRLKASNPEPSVTPASKLHRQTQFQTQVADHSLAPQKIVGSSGTGIQGAHSSLVHQKAAPSCDKSTPTRLAGQQPYYVDFSNTKAEPFSDPPEICQSPVVASSAAHYIPTPPTSSPFTPRRHFAMPSIQNSAPAPQSRVTSGLARSSHVSSPNFKYRPAPTKTECDTPKPFSPQKKSFQPRIQYINGTRVGAGAKIGLNDIKSRFPETVTPRIPTPEGDWSLSHDFKAQETPIWTSASDVVSHNPPGYIKHEPPVPDEFFPSPTSLPDHQRSISPMKPSNKRDVYQYGVPEDPDTSWSTLPRKKTKVEAEQVKHSGTFTLRGLGLHSHIRTGKTGMKADDKRRVITFLPPPLQR